MNCQHSPETQLGASQAFSSPGSGRYIHGSKPPTPLLLVLLFLSLTVLMPSLASARTYSLDDQIAFTYHTVTSDEDNVYFISASKPSGFYDTSKESYAVNYYVQPINTNETVRLYFLRGHTTERKGYVVDYSSNEDVPVFLARYTMREDDPEEFTIIISTSEEGNVTYRIDILVKKEDGVNPFYPWAITGMATVLVTAGAYVVFGRLRDRQEDTSSPQSSSRSYVRRARARADKQVESMPGLHPGKRTNLMNRSLGRIGGDSMSPGTTPDGAPPKIYSERMSTRDKNTGLFLKRIGVPARGEPGVCPGCKLKVGVEENPHRFRSISFVSDDVMEGKKKAQITASTKRVLVVYCSNCGGILGLSKLGKSPVPATQAPVQGKRQRPLTFQEFMAVKQGAVIRQQREGQRRWGG